MEDASKEYKLNPVHAILFIVAALTLSFFSARNISSETLYRIVLFIAYLVIFASGLFVTTFFLSISNREVKRQFGFSSLLSNVFNGFAFFFPFAVIAFITDIALNWNAIGAITSAAIFTSISVTSSDFNKSGGSRTGKIFISLLASLFFILLYTGCGIIATFVLR